MSGEEDPNLSCEYRAKNGDILEFAISRAACDKFGFYFSDRVETPIGPATVVGVRDNFLWFHVDGHTGASFWDNAKNYTELLSLGVSLISDKPIIPDKKGYKIKSILHNGKNIPIVLQNENGPCPLIGISNVLVLRGDIVIEGEGANKNMVTLDTLTDKLSGYLYQVNIEKGDEALALVEKATKVMPSLEFGLDVNFNFKACDDFEKTDQCKLFDQFGIRLVHGWLVDPDDIEMKKAIGDNTYNDLMNKLVALDEPPVSQSSTQPAEPKLNTGDAPVLSPTVLSPTTEIASPASSQDEPKKAEEPPKPLTEEDFKQGNLIRTFLQMTQSQLTATGLALLKSSVKEGEMCVFFRNNHFSTLTKHNGQLYILVTDIGFEKERNIVWDLLATVDGSSVFCTSDFRNADQENKEEVVNTLELMGFQKDQVETTLLKLTREEMSNSETAIQRAITILQQPQPV